MLKKIVFFLLASCIIASTVHSYASLFEDKNAYIQTTSNGEINWSDLTIRAKGSSREFFEDIDRKAADFTPEEAARSDAAYNLMETIKEVPISSSFHIDDEIFLFKETKVKFTKLVKEAKTVGKPVTSEDESVEVLIEVDLKGDILDMLFPKPYNLPEGLGKAFQGRGRYTSIIFDASKTELSPVLLPQVIDDEEKTYYILDKKNRKNAVKNGLVRYFKSIEAAKKARATGKMPFVISYLKSSKYREDALESPANILNKVRNDAFYSDILRRCKVIIIIK
jgi:hypothetical protein